MNHPQRRKPSLPSFISVALDALPASFKAAKIPALLHNFEDADLKISPYTSTEEEHTQRATVPSQ